MSKSFRIFASLIHKTITLFYWYIMNERERLLKIIAEEGMTAKQFAEESGIQAGTISNIVNGRNNPSLDVMQRVLNRFRTINSDWLILGIGNMYRTTANTAQNDIPSNGKPAEKTLFDETIQVPKQQTAEDLQASLLLHDKAKQIMPTEEKTQLVTKSIEKVMVFYSDGTFEEIIAARTK